jgi:hypothetical protein
VAAALPLGAAVLGLLALHAQLHVGKKLQPLAYLFPAFDAQTELVRALVKALERRVNPSQIGRAHAIAPRSDHLVHLVQRLLVLVTTHRRGIVPAGLDGDVSLGEDLRAQGKQSRAVSLHRFGSWSQGIDR